MTRDRSLSAQFEHTVGVTETGVRDFHPVADRRGPRPDPMTSEADEDAAKHYHGHRERLRARLREAGPAALADYELLELVLFRAHPQRDVKPLAKALLARFGSFPEAIAARAAPSGRGQGHGRERDRRIQDRRGRAPSGSPRAR